MSNEYRIWQDTSDEVQRDRPTNEWYRARIIARGHLGECEGPFGSYDEAKAA